MTACDQADITRTCNTRLSGSLRPYAPLASSVLRAANSWLRAQSSDIGDKPLRGGDPAPLGAASRAHLEALEAATAVLSSSATNWLLHPLRTLCLDGMRLCAEADVAAAAVGGKAGEYQELLADSLRRSFGLTLRSRPRGRDRASIQASKQMGSLFVANILSRLYFRLNNLRGCSLLLKSLQRPGSIPPLDAFPKSDQVTHQYYLGRIALFEDRYQEADECLSRAMRHCHRCAVHNRRLIMMNLVPARLQRGILPAESVLKRHRLTQYAPIVRAMRTGNVPLFRSCMREHRAFFIASGVYLLLERLELVVYRSLFRQVFAATGNTKMDLAALAGPLATVGIHVGLDELECLLANLVARRMIKGYINHKYRTLVVARPNPEKGTLPFPPVSRVLQ